METSEILPGDLLFVWGNSFIEEVIEEVTHGPSHVALFLDEQTIAEANWNRTTGASPLSNFLSGKGRLEVWRDDTLTDEERSKMVKYAREHFGIHYDYLGILVELARYELNFPLATLHEGKRRICSSYVNDCIKSIGRNWANVPYAPTPSDLLQGGKLTRKGALNNGK